MNVTFNFSAICDHVIHAAHEIRKQSSVEARVLSSSFVFLIPVLYLTCQCLYYIPVFSVKEKKLNKSWQFDFLVLRVIFSLLHLGFRSLVEIKTQLLPSPPF